jgi:hypothetical protein
MASFGLHLAIGLLVLTHYDGVEKRQQAQNPEPIQIIQAQLLIAPSLQQQALPSEAVDSPHPSEEKQSVEPEPLHETPQELAEVILPEDDKHKRAALPAIDYSPMEAANAITQVPSIKPPPLSSRELAQRHLSNYSKQADLKLAERAAKLYQQLKTAPTISSVTIDPYLTEDEKFQQKLTVKVDCSSTLNKTIAVISGITGGALDCSKTPQFDSYIDRRLNKLADPVER